jgi:hypothetical protein
MRRTVLKSPCDEKSDVERREAELGAAVIRYLAEHPRAMDNLQGIAEWWIMRQQVQVEAETLARVVQHLVDGGLIEKVDSANGPLYRLSR